LGSVDRAQTEQIDQSSYHTVAQWFFFLLEEKLFESIDEIVDIVKFRMGEWKCSSKLQKGTTNKFVDACPQEAFLIIGVKDFFCLNSKFTHQAR